MSTEYTTITDAQKATINDCLQSTVKFAQALATCVAESQVTPAAQSALESFNKRLILVEEVFAGNEGWGE